MPNIINIKTTTRIKTWTFRQVNKSPTLNYLLDGFGNLARCFTPSYTPGRIRSCYHLFEQVSQPTILDVGKDGLYQNSVRISDNTFLAQDLLEMGITGLNLEPGFTPEDLVHISKTGQPLYTDKISKISDQEGAKQLLETIRDKNLMNQLRTLGFAAIFSSISYMLYRAVNLVHFNGNFWDYAFSSVMTAGIVLDTFLVLKNQQHFIAGAKYTPPEAGAATKERVISAAGPKASILVPALNEPLDVLEQTLLAAGRQNYQNKEVVLLLDDNLNSESVTPTHEMIKRVNEILVLEERSACVKIFQRKKYVNVTNQERNKADNLNAFLVYGMGKNLIEYQDREGNHHLATTEDQDAFASFSPADHIVVIDADYKLFPNFLEETVAILEENPKAALVQTPQNLIPQGESETERVSAASFNTYWQYSKRGNAQDNSMFWGGTNCTIRFAALESIKQKPDHKKIEYIPTKNITEDLYTSLLLIQQGWDIAFVPKPMSEGIPISNLSDHFSTFWRYVEGTTEATLEQTLPLMLKSPKFAFSKQGLEFLSHGLQPLMGFSTLFFALCPALVSMGVNFAPTALYLFAPLFTLNLYLNSLSAKLAIRHLGQQETKKYDHLKSGLLFILHFPVYIHGMLSAIKNLALGKKAKFLRTPKDGERSMLPLKYLLPIIGTISLNSYSFIFSVEQYVTTGEDWRLVPALWSLLFASMATYGLLTFNGLKNTANDLKIGFKNLIK